MCFMRGHTCSQTYCARGSGPLLLSALWGMVDRSAINSLPDRRAWLDRLRDKRATLQALTHFFCVHIDACSPCAAPVWMTLYCATNKATNTALRLWRRSITVASQYIQSLSPFPALLSLICVFVSVGKKRGTGGKLEVNNKVKALLCCCLEKEFSCIVSDKHRHTHKHS